MAMYKFALNAALKKIAVARDWFAMKHAEDFDIDWAMEQFEHATDILERLRDLEGVEFDVNPDTYCCYGERKEE